MCDGRSRHIRMHRVQAKKLCHVQEQEKYAWTYGNQEVLQILQDSYGPQGDEVRRDTMAQKSTTPKVEEKQSLTKYFRGVKREFKRVVWPTKKQLFQYSLIVIFVSIVTALFIYAVDFVFSHIMGLIFGV